MQYIFLGPLHLQPCLTAKTDDDFTWAKPSLHMKKYCSNLGNPQINVYEAFPQPVK